jgi:hypothetical protein
MLARRSHNRLNAFLAAQQELGQQRRDHHGVNNHAVAMDVLDLVGLLDGREGDLAGLRLMLQQRIGEDDVIDDEEVESDREEEGENEAEDMDHDMEDDAVESEEDAEPQEEEDDDLLEFFDDGNESESEDFISIAEVETAPVAASLSSAESLMGDNDSVMMEVVENAKRRAHDQPRTVSISSADL